eukprot:CAMPEP_0202470090 /NCGR_PEP_ID=MMETSP1360-20130828/80481_1 /ASSEMBLY_ACC=CAM_ASM_000848 /TAXON_ID=515479 /ORGANISM="Licmophora paradoxa, Strain CCMP2313" /LENGTH=176 /DNA_ID=CAMNT_0049095655 /DNA_START=223 /DNA_END=753 /DNA_ORIENTATION=-
MVITQSQDQMLKQVEEAGMQSILKRDGVRNHEYEGYRISKQRNGVSFDTVTVRQYEMLLGDHPQVSTGPPVSIGWNYEQQQPESIDDFETRRCLYRKKQLNHMVMNYYKRTAIIERAGFTAIEIKAASCEADRIKRQRYVTRRMLPLWKIEDVIESTGRKAKRAVSRNQAVQIGTT